MQYYCTRFNGVYNAIPLGLRPPPGLALIKFPDGFDSDMAFQLRERNPPTLEDMQSITVTVESNLLSKRAKDMSERRIPLKEEISLFEQKLDAIIKGMDILGDRVETIKGNLLGIANKPIQGEILISEKTKTRTLERMVLTKILDPTSRRTMQKPPTLKVQKKILKLI